LSLLTKTLKVDYGIKDMFKKFKTLRHKPYQAQNMSAKVANWLKGMEKTLVHFLFISKNVS